MVVCPLNISDLRSLYDVVIDRPTVKLCQDYFDFDLPSVVIEKLRKDILASFETVEKAWVSL